MVPTGLWSAAFVGAGLLLRGVYRYASARGARIGNVASGGLVLAVIAGSAAAGPFFADRPVDAAYPRGPAVVLTLSVAALCISVAAKVGAARPRSLHLPGVGGRAFIRSIREQEGRSAKGLPVFEIDMDVTAPEVPPFRTVHHEEIPARMAETVREGSTFPVLVDPATRRVTLDWISPPPRRTRDGFADDGARPPRVPLPVVTTSPLAMGGSAAAGTKTVTLVVVMVLLGAVASGLNALLASDEAPVVVAPGSIETGLAGGSRVGASRQDTDPVVGFSFELPHGWREDTASVSDPGPGLVVDLAVRSGQSKVVVTRSRSLSRILSRPAGGPAAVFTAVETELGEAIVDERPVEVAGAAGMQYDLRPGAIARLRRIVVPRADAVLLVTLQAPEGDWERATAALDEVVSTWAWH